MIEQIHDGLTVRLKAWHDLSWLKQFGQVFCVFDQLISGNLCFGVTDGEHRHFIKYAGAPTLMYAGQAEAAIQQLKASHPKYLELQHPALNQPVYAFDTSHGHGLVFKWFDGFALAPLDMHLKRLKGLPLIEKLSVFDSLMDCLVQAEHLDYLIAGLSDHHILIDFERTRPMLSSVSHFVRFPARVPHPKLPGATWYIPPEGYKVGTELDTCANAYALGALAFTFFGNQLTRSIADWTARQPLFDIAHAALREDPGVRLETAARFQSLWREAVLRIPKF